MNRILFSLLFSLLFASKVLATGFPENNVRKNIVHISIDDVHAVFRDLTEKQHIYNSIFDQPFLGKLKEFHDKYGAVFSLYCFLKSEPNTPDWDLERSTGKWAKEFAKHRKWLKFGIHQGLVKSNFARTTEEEVIRDVTYLNANLKRIVGLNKKSIDIIPRLHNFAGNLISCKTFVNNFGYKGFLGFSNKGRISYYLDSLTSDKLVQEGYHYDYANKIHFFSSETRFESVIDITTFLNGFLDERGKPKIRDLMFFTHEVRFYDQKTPYLLEKIDAACQFAVKHGYVFDFPQNIIK